MLLVFQNSRSIWTDTELSPHTHRTSWFGIWTKLGEQIVIVYIRGGKWVDWVRFKRIDMNYGLNVGWYGLKVNELNNGRLNSSGSNMPKEEGIFQ